MNLSDHIDRIRIVSQIEADVEAFSRADLQDDPRTHLGASVIGDPCSAKLWNDFRWLKQEQFDGKTLRLFDRGKREEACFVAILRGIGFDVREFESDDKQYRIAGVNGHFGGSLDALAYPPPLYDIPEWIVAEFKTHKDKSFTKLAGAINPATKRRENGLKVRAAKPLHFTQMSCYGRAYGARYGLYCAVNKDTDELYFELVALDWNEADSALIKAQKIIGSQTQPLKISQTKTFFQCKYCVHSPICFDGEKPEKNCRSCKFAVPIERGDWACTNDASEFSTEKTCYTLDAKLIASGCPHWTPIINE